MYKPSVIMPAPRSEVVAIAYPYGKYKNESTPNAKDAAYLDQSWVNEFNGFSQAALVAAGITPNNSPETAADSQVLTAIRKLANATSAPKIVGGLQAAASGSWVGTDDSVNIASVTPVTVAASGKQVGDLAVVATTPGAKALAVSVNPSASGVRFGAMYGSTPENDGANIKIVSCFGFRATLQFTGGTWVIVNASDAKYNSAEIDVSPTAGPVVTKGVGYLDAIWPVPFTGFEFSENWIVQDVISPARNALQSRDYTPMVTHLETAGLGGRAARVYFLPNKPVRAYILMDGSTPTIWSGASSSGITSMSYASNTLTVNHDVRSGSAACQFGSVSSSTSILGIKITVFPVGATKTEIQVFDIAGAPLSIADLTLFSFSREVGEGDAQDPAEGTRITITNGVGIMQQDSSKMLGNINIHQVNDA